MGVGLLVAAPVAEAAQGGCSTYTGTDTQVSPAVHWSIGICINDNNTNTAATADYYVNKPVLPSNCVIDLEFWNDSGTQQGRDLQDSNSCAQGHHPLLGLWCMQSWTSNTIVVHSFFRLRIAGKQTNTKFTNSPIVDLTNENTGC
jgi:hypothetical protein